MVSQFVLHKYDDTRWIALFHVTKANVFRLSKLYISSSYLTTKHLLSLCNPISLLSLEQASMVEYTRKLLKYIKVIFIWLNT